MSNQWAAFLHEEAEFFYYLECCVPVLVFGDKLLEVTYMKEKYNTPDCHCSLREFDTEVWYFSVVPICGVISLLLKYMDFVVCSEYVYRILEN